MELLLSMDSSHSLSFLLSVPVSPSEAPQGLSSAATEEESAPSGNPGEFEELGKRIKGLISFNPLSPHFLSILTKLLNIISKISCRP